MGHQILIESLKLLIVYVLRAVTDDAAAANPAKQIKL